MVPLRIVIITKMDPLKKSLPKFAQPGAGCIAYLQYWTHIDFPQNIAYKLQIGLQCKLCNKRYSWHLSEDPTFDFNSSVAKPIVRTDKLRPPPPFRLQVEEIHLCNVEEIHLCNVRKYIFEMCEITSWYSGSHWSSKLCPPPCLCQLSSTTSGSN